MKGSNVRQSVLSGRVQHHKQLYGGYPTMSSMLGMASRRSRLVLLPSCAHGHACLTVSVANRSTATATAAKHDTITHSSSFWLTCDEGETTCGGPNRMPLHHVVMLTAALQVATLTGMDVLPSHEGMCVYVYEAMTYF